MTLRKDVLDKMEDTRKYDVFAISPLTFRKTFVHVSMRLPSTSYCQPHLPAFLLEGLSSSSSNPVEMTLQGLTEEFVVLDL